MPVEIVTLVPAFSRFVMSVFRICESALVAVQLPVPEELLGFVTELEITTSYGSNSHCPESPLLALASPDAPMVDIQRPEVSILPPSPPSAPPRANKVPCTFVTPALFCVSDQATTVPPLPF